MNDIFTNELLDDIGGPLAEKLESKNVLSREQTKDALASLSPVLLSSLKRKQDHLGAEELEALLQQAGASEEHADDLDALLSRSDSQGALVAGIMDDEEQGQTAAALSQKLGIGGSAAKKLIPMLVPVILSMLMKKGQQHGGTNTRAGGIGAILDRDGDGQIIDDIAGMVLQNMGGGKQAGGGFLSSILGMFLGRK